MYKKYVYVVSRMSLLTFTPDLKKVTWPWKCAVLHVKSVDGVHTFLLFWVVGDTHCLCWGNNYWSSFKWVLMNNTFIYWSVWKHVPTEVEKIMQTIVHRAICHQNIIRDHHSTFWREVLLEQLWATALQNTVWQGATVPIAADNTGVHATGSDQF